MQLYMESPNKWILPFVNISPIEKEPLSISQIHMDKLNFITPSQKVKEPSPLSEQDI